MSELLKSSLLTLDSIEGSFIIPSYQRAYRWGRKQVENLLDDFYEFATGSGKTFFLQPLVLCPSDTLPDAYELIDGQQRLTTLYLLDAALCHVQGRGARQLRYGIVYQARADLEDFLKGLVADNDIQFEDVEESLDFYCLFQAWQIIRNWLANKDMGDFLPTFHARLLNNVKFLWHDSSVESDSSPAQKFIRINTGKIPLADGELCRALFLMPHNHDLSADFPSPSCDMGREVLEHIHSRLLYKRRLILAHDWDVIERSLHDESFWNFIGGAAYKDSVRMGFLLELHNNVQAAFPGEHVCFDKYSHEFNTINLHRDAAQAWEELVESLERLKYWYRDNDYYHWIGYLTLMNGCGALSFLLGQARMLTETEFRSLVKDEIRKSIAPDLPPLDELSFQNNYLLCKNILILFNIEYSRRHQGHSPRFPFPVFSLENNTIEHVYARNVESLKEWEDRVQWIEEHRNFIAELDYGQVQGLGSAVNKACLTVDEFSRRKREILEMADKFIFSVRNGEKISEEIMTERFNAISDSLSKFIERHEDDDVHTLYNLALLDHDLNSYFRNSIFAIKQKKLCKRLLEGKTFIPAGTIALFMRHFERGRREAPWWTREDQEDYRAVLGETLGEFWPKLKINESPGVEPDNGAA